MAQLDDNDQRQQARARRPNASRRTADERRHGHDHLLLASPCSRSSPASSCCRSTSPSSCCSAASTSSAASADASNELGAGGASRRRRESHEKPATRPKGGQYLGRRPRARHESRGQASSNSATVAAAADTIMQSEPSRPSARTRDKLVTNVAGLDQAAARGSSSHTATCRSNRRSQLDRQLSDSSGIGARLMNVLRIDDDLSSSSSSVRFLTTRTTDSNMLMGHPQQQQQQQELDTRSLSLAATTTTTATSGAAMNSTAATATTTSTPYAQHNHQDQLLLARAGPQMPLVVVSPIPPLHASPPVPQYPHQGLYLSSPEAAGVYGQPQPSSSSYAMYPVMEPLVMHSSPSPFHDHEHLHHQHHLNQHQHHHHHHHHPHNHPHNQNRNRHIESLAYPADQLALDENQQQQLSYADLDEEMARDQAKRRQQRQEQSGPGLPESVIQANSEQLDSGQQRPRHQNPYNYYQSDQMLPQQQQQHQTYSESGGLPSAIKAAEATTLTALNASLDHSHRHQRLGISTDSRCRLSQAGGDLSSSVGLDVGQQLSQSPNEMEDELKVCEWRDCGNTFLDMNEFVRHLEEKHVNLEPAERNRFFCMWHNCKRNNQEFNARYKLLIHMRVHSGEKPYNCQSESCKKSFSRLENLKIHMRSHTGEKPYECQYENCAKKFTNSSDRIKHHKTHKDPKPYNCSHDGCTKRYTDPSSLRKHLRAHKRHAFGCSMDSSGEAPIVADMMSKPRQQYQQQHQIHESPSTGCSFAAPHLDRSLSQSANHYGPAPDRNEHHQQEQPQQQHSYDQFASSGSSQHQPLIEIVQDQHELGGYLHADYDPSREFASVLFSPGEPTEMSATRDHNQAELASCVTERAAAYYNEHSDYGERSAYQQQQAPIEAPIAGGSSDYYRPKVVQADQNEARYLVPPPARTSFSSRQRPSYAGRSWARADDLHERHQQLSKSWCGASGSSSMRASFSQAPTGLWAQPAGPSRADRMEAVAQDGCDLQAHKSRRRVGFDCEVQEGGGNYEQSRWPPQAERQQANYQQQQMEDVRYEKYPSHHQQPQQHWQPATSSSANIRHGNHHQSQPPPPQQQQQQHQHQLTRSQQHAQLMRSMPADVNFLQSRGPQRGFN